MNAGIINCLTAKGSSGQKAKSQRFTNTGGFLGGNHPPHVRNKGNLRKKKSALNFHFQNVCSQLCFEEIRKPSEMNPPNQSRYSTTDVKLTLPMSPCPQMSSISGPFATPPVRSEIAKIPPQCPCFAAPRKHAQKSWKPEQRPTEQGAMNLWMC